MLQSVDVALPPLIAPPDDDSAREDAREVDQLAVQLEKAVAGLRSVRGCPGSDDIPSPRIGGRDRLSTV